jgi:hypothetical protein
MKDKNWEPEGPSDFDEQTDAFRFELDDLINRYLSEFDINAFTIMGALQEQVIELSNLGSFEADIDLDDFLDEE